MRPVVDATNLGSSVSQLRDDPTLSILHSDCMCERDKTNEFVMGNGRWCFAIICLLVS
jgi:hypothetical protein